MSFEKEKHASKLESRMLEGFELFKDEKNPEVLLFLDSKLEEIAEEEGEKIFMPTFFKEIVGEISQEDCDEYNKYGLCSMLKKFEISFDGKAEVFEAFAQKPLSDWDKEFLFEFSGEDLELWDKYFPNEIVEIPGLEFDDESEAV